ncbi:glycoside hydrolase family 25 protein [Catenulispora sp. NF23]|uniref:Glycoside hydrolase family 25 protein n=1 Tax=Catenulispora pinistramenti TaxID=2705254 RepID=A0ABS5KJQ5_9ACTN|nr:glycoside hydrolase family 25 protein [Catenulispora pinistramenti]MBS2531580.1 glycoside hydrolase family 25 protein [Catenulispora pinistramenti]MBS2546170.1 glycoside hydrolase family 25 protein [Catenulispora pinistramenti]
MTVFFPDISSYENGLTIQPGTVAVIAKATEGTYYNDGTYEEFKAQAARVGALFSAYHFLKAGNGAAQAEYCFEKVGSTPVMLDVEVEGDSKPTVQDCLDFITRMRALGGRVWGAYFPRWFWEQVGGNLASLGVAIVASGYPGGYSDTDPDWNGYGGITPAIWQYTDSQPYGGQRVDFNAYRGTTAQLADLINGTSSSPATPEPPATNPTEDDHMPAFATGEIPNDTNAHIVAPPPANTGGNWGNVWFSLGCDFGDCTVRVAAYIPGRGWDIRDNVVVPAAGGRINPWGGPLPNGVQKISIVRHTTGPALAYLIEAAAR